MLERAGSEAIAPPVDWSVDAHEMRWGRGGSTSTERGLRLSWSRVSLSAALVELEKR